jgi:hypothetical protein
MELEQAVRRIAKVQGKLMKLVGNLESAKLELQSELEKSTRK